MSLTSIFLVLIASIFHVLRTLMMKTAKNKLVFVWWMTMVSFLMLLPFCIYFFIKTQPALQMILFSMAVGLVHASYWVSYALAYEKGEVSHVYPIIHSAPALVLLFGVLFLKEHPSLFGIIGILLITAGLYFINLKEFSFHRLLEPLRSIFIERHTGFAFLALIFVTAYSLLDKVAVSNMHPMAYNLTMTSSALIIFSFFIRKQLKTHWLKPIKQELKKVLAGAVFASISYPLILFALQLTSASYVSAFRQVNVILASLVGFIFLKEKISPLRLISVGLIFIGAILVAMS